MSSLGKSVLKNKSPPNNNTCNHCLKLRVDNYSSLEKEKQLLETVKKQISAYVGVDQPEP